MLYDPRRSSVSKIERESGVKFEHISAPQPADIAKAAGVEAAETITQVSDRCTFCLSSSGCLRCFQSIFFNIYILNCSVIPVFESAAQELLDSSGLSAVELLSKALAKAAVSYMVLFLHCYIYYCISVFH